MKHNITIVDASGAAFFLRELEHVKARSYDVVYQDLIARELFPVSNEAPEAVDTITYRTYDMVGMAKLIHAYANDIPRVDVTGKETTIKVFAAASAFGYSRDEILKSQYTGLPLDQRRANASQRAFDQIVDDIAWNGDAVSGLIGVLSDPNVPSTNSVTVGGWLAATPDEIIQDVNVMVGTYNETTRMKEKSNTLLLPVAEYNHINGTPRASNSDTTIAKFILMNVEGVNEIRACNELSDTGISGARTAILYDKNPDKLQLEIPKELEFLPPQEKGLELEVNTWGKIAGVNIYYPLSMLKLEDV